MPHRSDPTTLAISNAWIAAIAMLAWAVSLVGTPCRAQDAEKMGEEPVVALVVCPPEFDAAIGPWIEHRQSDGIRVVKLPSQSTAEKLQASIREAADDQTRYVVLIGDAPAIGTPCDVQSQIPTGYSKSVVTAKWGSTPTLASDLSFGDLDGDGVPELCVGRLPVDDAGSLTKLVDRIIAYETCVDFGDWRNQVQLVGGVGGFGAFADSAIESVTRSVVTGVLPPETRTIVSYASEGHMFCPVGDSFTSAVVDRYCRGCRFWVYAGHGSVTRLDRFPRTAEGMPILDSMTVRQLQNKQGVAPIAMLLCCFTGAFDASEDSFAEQLLLHDGGAIAVLSGSRVTMPYGNATAAVSLIDGVYAQRLPRLGDAWLVTLRQIMKDDEANRSSIRVMMDGLATMISPAGTKLIDERSEHAQLYNLLGDPMLRLNPPQPVQIKAETGYQPGTPITIELTSPIDGRLTLSCHHPLGASSAEDPNETQVAVQHADVAAGLGQAFAITLPEKISGPMILRAHVSGVAGWASGAARTNVRQ
ncbi:C25 family cysteine peptidase [Stieleria varia]|uniref:Lys-gingipain W83 n=1 Tax=Stieleria varia TaxID=2528005 RepID=A0A5C6AFP3_9BACT|nr:C25 family cysteine peptidase [Stieleria varia]TWT98246.1 Lys-gingipain W83 precursor [Stieleria varia]